MHKNIKHQIELSCVISCTRFNEFANDKSMLRKMESFHAIMKSIFVWRYESWKPVNNNEITWFEKQNPFEDIIFSTLLTKVNWVGKQSSEYKR